MEPIRENELKRNLSGHTRPQLSEEEERMKTRADISRADNQVGYVRATREVGWRRGGRESRGGDGMGVGAIVEKEISSPAACMADPRHRDYN